MISITQKSDTEISIIFKKASQSIKEQATKAIINAFPENQNYLFEISGVDIDRFVEDMHSNKYLLKMDEKHRFIKNLPELLLFSNCLEDAKVFGQFIGSFNEGYRYLHILKKENINFCNEQDILNFIQENKLLTIEVASDGDNLNVSCIDAEKMEIICRFLGNEISN
jgi:hypothetical protein